MNVFSPKLKPYGLEWRWVPIVDELEPLLLDSIEMMPDGETHILPKKLRENKNLSTTAKKIVARTGEQVWPNFFNDMRASFATDMLKIAPDYQVGR